MIIKVISSLIKAINVHCPYYNGMSIYLIYDCTRRTLMIRCFILEVHFTRLKLSVLGQFSVPIEVLRTTYLQSTTRMVSGGQ